MGAVEELAAFFGVDKSELLFGACYKKTAALAGDGLSNDELKLVDIYRNVTEQGRQEMMAHAEYIGERHKKNPSASAGKVV